LSALATVRFREALGHQVVPQQRVVQSSSVDAEARRFDHFPLVESFEQMVAPVAQVALVERVLEAA
jgi:hypothetical protein